MGKSSKQTVGYWYLPAFHVGLGTGPIDAYLEFRGGDKTAWAGRLTASGTISINAPNLWGGEKDQGGIVGAVDVMFGEADQQVNPYLTGVFGPQQSAWRGLATLVFRGGKYGAMNPYPQKASHKIEKILAGWDNDECWYPAKAAIASTDQTIVSHTATGWEYVQLPRSGDPYQPGHNELSAPTSGWAAGQSPFGSGWTPSGLPARNTNWGMDTVLWVRRNISIPSNSNAVVQVFAENGCCIFINGSLWRTINQDNVQISQGDVIEFQLPPGDYELSIKAFDEYPSLGDTYLSAAVALRYGKAMNPAHILYYSITQSDMGNEPGSNINGASFTAGADWYYAQEFGLCTSYDPSAESVEEFQQRVCRVAGCSLSRSLVDGQWYLDIGNGEYDLASLPILTDDDILEFEEQPTLLDGAVNSVSVKYFDPSKKETIVTPPVQAPALVADYGVNHLVLEYPELSTASLALRVAQRELQARITPLRGFPLKTTRKPHAWRVGTYFRLQSPKRRIADMVCILGEKSSGKLRSGAMSITATQDVYSLPLASFVEVEEGVDTRPSVTPKPISMQRAFEAPYAEVSATLTRADLALLPEESGFLLAVASDPAASRDYTLRVQSAGGEYETVTNGNWCSTARVVDDAGYVDTEFSLGQAKGLTDVVAGMPALWDGEIVRVDAIDSIEGTITLARGCADTIPALHAANSLLWFYETAAAGDLTEYTDGETINVKLLTNTATQQLDELAAPVMSVVFDSRAARPYPPANFKINGEYWPEEVTGDIVLTWNHRDRVAQANVLLGTAEASTGPEAGVTYTAEFFTEVGTVAIHSATGIAGDSVSWTPPSDGTYRVELKSVRGSLDSLQKYVHVVTRGAALWTPASLSIPPSVWFAGDSSPYTEVSGALAEIRDLSGNENHVTQSNASTRPTRQTGVLNGMPVIRFDGVNDVMVGPNTTAATTLLNSVAEAWCIVLYKNGTAAGGNRYIFSIVHTSGSSARFIAVASSTSGGTYTNRPGVGGRSAVSPLDSYSEMRSAVSAGTDWVIAHHRINFPGKLGAVKVNGAAEETAAMSGMSAANSQAVAQSRFTLGPAVSANSFNGDIAEILFGTGVLSAGDVQKLEGYLAHKWGLAANLPGGHPYKVTPPSL